MITSKEILVKTSISRATLNNYIKFGILPKPVVRSAGADLTGIDLTGVDLKGTKHIGYFPKDVLDDIATVKRLKREGRSMKEIVREFTQRQSVGEMYPHERTEETGSNHAADRQSLYLTSRTTDGNFALTIDNIDSPAFLLNHNFEIEWINHKAEDQIFKRIISKISDPESRNIFKIFLDLEFHAHIRNWEELITFHMGFMKINFTKDMLPTLFQGISNREISLLEKIYDKDSISVNSIQSFPLNLVMQDSSTKSYQVYSMLFREGIFFVYVQDQDGLSYNIKSLLSAKAKIINELLEQRMPSLVSLCVLVADLQNSVKISAELLPGEYFELINQLWATVTSSFDKYDAIYGKHTGDGMLYYFIKKPGSNYIINSINCAIELKEQMKKFSDEWKVRKGWLNDLVLNIGISEGQEFLGTIRSSSNIELTTLGDSINYAANYAARLSDFARSGSIWTTKNLISKLDREEITKIRFGICRKKDGREIFLQNSFSRIIDLIDIDDRNYRKLIDVAMLPVTEIFGTTG
jgi:class 3 adenylate cyclase